jgi:hypothetical protein
MADVNLDQLPGFYDGIDFRLVAPNLEQKQWMVMRISSGVEKACDIAKRYHFNRKHLNILAKRRRQGKPVHFGSGRPRVLDLVSHRAIESNISDLTCSNVDDLRAQIKSEYFESLIRRYPQRFQDNAGDEIPIIMARRTHKRYIARLHPGVFPAAPMGPNLEANIN